MRWFTNVFLWIQKHFAINWTSWCRNKIINFQMIVMSMSLGFLFYRKVLYLFIMIFFLFKFPSFSLLHTAICHWNKTSFRHTNEIKTQSVRFTTRNPFSRTFPEDYNNKTTNFFLNSLKVFNSFSFVSFLVLNVKSKF